MTGDDHDPDKNPRIKQIDDEVEDQLKYDEDEVERIEQLLRKAMKKFEDGTKWPDE